MYRARLLDISRLVSRAGMRPTGVDRVEFAYLNAFLLDRDVPIFGLCRTALGYVMLDREGLEKFRRAVESNSFPFPDIISRLNKRLTPAARRGQTQVRWSAMARARVAALPRLLATLPPGFVYFNVGHSNLSGPMLRTIKDQRNAKVAVLIHDLIPLQLPDLQRAGTVARFRKLLTAALREADTLICSTRAVATDVQEYAGPAETQPRIVIAPLGVETPVPIAEDIPPGIGPSRPYFVMLGTIEPRKNHAMMLDIWDGWGSDAPGLLILGKRGWKNEDVFARLDAGVPHVKEIANLSDGAIAALLQKSNGLLFPTHAEGFGLPPVEAAMLGVPVICSDIPVCREVMGDWPVYVTPTDRYEWERQIKRLLHDPGPRADAQMDNFDWSRHIKIVLASIG